MRALLLLAGLALAGCSRPDAASGGAASGASAAASAAALPAAALADGPAGDVAAGKALAEKFECSRCHEGTGTAPPTQVKACFGCHQDILAGKFGKPGETLERWKQHVEPHRDAPSLEHVGARFSRAWLQAFLLQPRDLRPHLAASMPRLPLTADEARDLAAFLTAGAPAAAAVPGGDVARGRQLLEQKGCGSCHELSGAPPLPVRPDPAAADERLRRAVRLAPDLAHTRDRWAAGPLVAWLLDPVAVKPGTLMPSHGLSREDAVDLAAYLLRGPFTPAAPRAVPARLPLLERKVTYAEVEERVLGKICRHCHGEPDNAMGDGGPGNTGGFGFAPKGLSFTNYEATQSGFIGPDGKRHSAFEKLTPPEAGSAAPETATPPQAGSPAPETATPPQAGSAAPGTPRLLALLLLRQREEAGHYDPVLRGMPLGFPAATPEEVQLVETWIAQGRPK